MQTAVFTPPVNLYDLSRAQLRALLASWGYSAYHAEQLWMALYRALASSWEALADLSETPIRADLLEHLADETALRMPTQQVAIDSSDGHTRKFLLRLHDGETIETVLMYFKGRATACISTQVGCAMGCVFCATGQMGFMRHLTSGEIVAQVIFVERLLRAQGESLRNVVLMGMGEPLHNYDNTMTAVETLVDHSGLAIAPKHLTLSTVGVVPGILRLAEEKRPLRLAVSLHAATDEERQALVPPAHRWPLEALMDACHIYVQKRRQRIFFEWTLIEGQNDMLQQAHALGLLLSDLKAHVNLIPLNPTVEYDGKPTQRPAVKAFQAVLTSYGIPSTVRQRRGIDIAAGCGQLRARTPAAPDNP